MRLIPDTFVDSDAFLDSGGDMEFYEVPPPQFLQPTPPPYAPDPLPDGYFMTAKRVVKHMNECTIADCYDDNGVFKYVPGVKIYRALMADGR